MTADAKERGEEKKSGAKNEEVLLHLPTERANLMSETPCYPFDSQLDQILIGEASAKAWTISLLEKSTTIFSMAIVNEEHMHERKIKEFF